MYNLELYHILSKAGRVLHETTSKNDLVRSVAGSALRCFSSKSSPSLRIKNIARQICTAGLKLYRPDEVFLATCILQGKLNF